MDIKLLRKIGTKSRKIGTVRNLASKLGTVPPKYGQLAPMRMTMTAICMCSCHEGQSLHMYNLNR